ncbi:helix-turn-helix domain-containing protein [Lactococcus kimchii]|uniref:helix-turn-helix domain-containing protein n=1 Tax=Lactococcus sp. S-13 TaxID=2507158 RepID=UPI0010235115|nr:helix-turn-helix transcriptional regulator [Lactococcus sp. S-13]RZI49425.1 XRE family transcriptional regulator [Lactococcus sp. S-13]
MTFGENLQKARIKSQFTQEEVAEKLFVTRQTVSRWETDRTLPNIYYLKDLSNLYSCTTDELIRELVTPKQSNFFKINRDYIQDMMRINFFWFKYLQFALFLWLFCLWGLLLGGVAYSILSFSNGATLLEIGKFTFFIFLAIPLYFISLWTIKTIRLKK